MVNSTIKYLVSIVVITYNSEKYIIETLESIKSQDYDNIEIIISDDCSQDNTVQLCKEWIKENYSRFARVELVTTNNNRGIPANCNRGVAAAKGEWIKLIAGDDLMNPFNISSNLEFSNRNQNVSIVISNMLMFKSGEQKPEDGTLRSLNRIKVLNDPVDSELQYKYLLKSYFGNSTTLFIRKTVFDEVTFDETLPFIEDYPFSLNVTKKGYVFHFLNMVTAYYRISQESVFMSKPKNKLYNDFYLKRNTFDEKYRFPYLKINEKKKEIYSFNQKVLFDRYGLNKNNLVCRLLFNLVSLLNIFRYI